MNIQDAQREVRSVYIGGFVGQLVSSVIWLVSAAVGRWVTPKASILTVIIGGFFIFAFTQMILILSGRRARVLTSLLLEQSSKQPHPTNNMKPTWEKERDTPPRSVQW